MIVVAFEKANVGAPKFEAYSAATVPLEDVSVSVDPDFDTAEVLKKYARLRGAEKPNWFFLTGGKDEIYRLMHDDFKLPIAENSKAANEPITHSAKLVLVDRRGRIRGYYSGMEAETMKDVAAEVLKVLQEKE